MGLKDNLFYWKLSLENPEPFFDDYYFSDKLIIADENLIKNIEALRSLILSFCHFYKKDKSFSLSTVDKILELLETPFIQHNEFIAFWKALDFSFSIFKKINLSNRKQILIEILKKYCEYRNDTYSKFGFSNVTVQALYDTSASKRKSISGIIKIRQILVDKFSEIKEATNLKAFNEHLNSYFFVDNNNIFFDFSDFYNLSYRFAELHQNKFPDIVFKINNQIFVLEAKHIKESGGSQDKQLTEIIDFIAFSEKSRRIHYISFLDGAYFNNFISPKTPKILKQKNDIEQNLKQNPKNFFVNTIGFISILNDL